MSPRPGPYPWETESIRSDRAAVKERDNVGGVSSRLRSQSPRRGIVLMVLGIGLISINDALTKWALEALPVGEAIFIRGLFALFCIAAVLPRFGGISVLAWGSARAHAVPAMCFTAGIFAFVISLSLMPLAIASVMVFTSPLFVTAFAPLLLGERVGWWRRGAVIAGFVGAAIVVQPGGATFSWVFLLPLLAAFLDALREISIRRVIGRETSLSLLFTSLTAVTAASLFTAPLGWLSPGWQPLGLLALAGVCLSGGLFLMIEAIRVADVSVVSPFKYSAVIWAALLGFLIWGHVPTLSVIAGAGMIVSGGLVILYRERIRPSRAGGV